LRGSVLDVLREEELDLLICEVTKLGAEDIVDANMVSISPAEQTRVSGALGMRMWQWGSGDAAVWVRCRSGFGDSRKVRYSQ
jgi:hypothetical protein